MTATTDPAVVAADLPGNLRDALRLIAREHRIGANAPAGIPWPAHVSRTFDDTVSPEEADQLHGLGLVEWAGSKFFVHLTDFGLQVADLLEGVTSDG